MEDELLEFSELLSASLKLAIREKTILYRARSCESTKDSERITKNPSYELGANPDPATKEGRFHTIGDYSFYLSNDSECAISEVKKSKTISVVIGEFEVIRPTTVFSIIPKDYENFYFEGQDKIKNLVASVSLKLGKESDYEESKKIIGLLKDKELLTSKDQEYGLFIIRYKSVRFPCAENYFMCGAVEYTKIFGLCERPKSKDGFPIPTDFGFLSFKGYKQHSC